MAFTLTLTGASVGTLDLNDQTKPGAAHLYSIMVQDWRPEVSRRRTGQIGGVTYEAVREVLPLTVLGHTRAAVLDALNDLATALDESYLYSLGSNTVNPLLLNWLPEGSSLANPVAARIIQGDTDFLSLQPSFNKKLQGYYVEFELTVWRVGLWSDTTTTALIVTTVTQPGVASVSGFTAAPGVQDLSIGLSTLDRGGGFVVVANRQDSIALIDLDNTISGTYFTDVTSVANAVGGDVKQSNFSSAVPGSITIRSDVSFPSLARTGRYSVFVTARNNSTTVPFALQITSVRSIVGSAVDLPEATQPVVVDTETTDARPVYLGTFSYDYDDDFMFNLTASQPTASVLTDLQIDTMMIVAHDENTRIINIDQLRPMSGGLNYLRIVSGLQSRPGCFMNRSAGEIVRHAYNGDIYLPAAGTTTYCIMYMTHEEYFYLRDTSDDSQSTISVQAIRRNVYPIPK